MFKIYLSVQRHSTGDDRKNNINSTGPFLQCWSSSSSYWINTRDNLRSLLVFLLTIKVWLTWTLSTDFRGRTQKIYLPLNTFWHHFFWHCYFFATKRSHRSWNKEKLRILPFTFCSQVPSFDFKVKTCSDYSFLAATLQKFIFDLFY